MLEYLAKKYLIYKIKKDKMSKYCLILSVKGAYYEKID